MKGARLTPNEQTQYGWLYPGGLFIELTEGWTDEWMGMCYLLLFCTRGTAVGMQLQQLMLIHKEKNQRAEPGNAGRSSRPILGRNEMPYTSEIG